MRRTYRAPAPSPPSAAVEGRVTAVEPQERRGGRRYNVFLDGRYAFSLAEELAAGLRVSQELARAEVEQLLAADQLQRATDAAFRFLGVRPRSQREVRDRLLRAGFAEAVVAQVEAKLARLGLVDDAAFARYWVEQRQSFRPRGARLLERELRLKGVDPELAAETALAAGDPTAAAEQAARKKAAALQRLPDREFRQKLGAFLARRGFDWETIKTVVDRLRAEPDED